MRFPVLTTLSLVACALVALPASAGTAREAWEDRVYLLTRISATSPVCYLVGYTIDTQGATAAFSKEMADAPKSGVTAAEAEAFAIAEMTQAKTDVAVITANLDSDNIDVAFKAFQGAFLSAEPVCKAMAEESPYVKPGPFQASGRRQTYENFMEFRAETGTADDMIRVVDMYVVGHIPDPGHVKQLAFTRRAAEKRHPKAAIYMASNYIAGESVEKSNEKAVMWLIIADALGHPEAKQFIADYTAKLTPAEAARAESDANTWLKAHPAA